MKADSKASTEQLWRLLSNGLRSFLRQRVPDDAIADDLVQETFLRVHQRRESVRDDQSLTSWVYQIARNLVIDYYRREGSQVSKLDISEIGNPTQASATNHSPANARDNIGAWTIAAVERLPKRYAEAVRSYELDGLTQRQVADQLGISYEAAKSRIKRGRLKLKQLLTACCEFEFDARGNLLDFTAKSSDNCCGDGHKREEGTGLEEVTNSE